ncbi:MAG TPA: ferredoxin reductase [Ktedonobacterales bacterium]|nr:ferredoxin reductase [Ktedonobacterales bacterium]
MLRHIDEAPHVKSLVLDVPGWAGHRAGQHLDVRLTAEDGYQTERSYSISSAPAEPQVTLTIERLDDGEVSPYLTDVLHPGDELEVRGPIGGWFTWRPEEGGPLLLVAGGSGVAPLMAMIRQRAAVRSPAPVCLLYSSRTYEEIIFREELDRSAVADGDLVVDYTLTRTQPPGWQGYSRRIDRAMLEEVAWAPEEHPLIFVCGPTPLVESVATLCVGLGYTPERIKTERFGPTGGDA